MTVDPKVAQQAEADAQQVEQQLGVPTIFNARHQAFASAVALYQKTGEAGFRALFERYIADVKAAAGDDSAQASMPPAPPAGAPGA